MEEARFIRPNGAASILGVCDRTIYNWIRRGVLPAIRIGGTILIPREAFERLLENNAENTDPVP